MNNTKTFVVMGSNRWGASNTLVAAKANFRAEGGRLSDGYLVLTFDEDTEFEGVDQMGYVHYRSRIEGQPPNEPSSQEFPPK